MEKRLSKKDYIEWKYYMALKYSKRDALVKAVYETLSREAERDGYLKFLEADRKDITHIIKVFITDVGKSKNNS